MASVTERLQFILSLDSSSAVKGFQQVGTTADKELSRAEQKIDKLGSGLTKFGAGAMAFAGAAGVGLFKLGQGAAEADANMSALEQVVGDVAAQDIASWAEGSAKAVGTSSKDAVAAATSFAQLGNIIGLSGDELTGFSTDLVKLSADFAAFKNVSPDQALQDIQAGFAGSTEVLRKYGIFLDDATLKSAYFRETGQQVSGTLTSQQRIIAINSELYRQGADMIGQWGRESGEAAGQQAQLKANLENLGDAIGRGVLPIMTKVTSVIGSVVSAFESLPGPVKATIGQVAGFGAIAAGVVGGVSLLAGQMIKLRATFKPDGNIGRLTASLADTQSKAGKAGTALEVGAAVGLAAWGSAAHHAAQEAQQFNDVLAELESTSAADALAGLDELIVAGGFAGKDISETFLELARNQQGAALSLNEYMAAQIRAGSADQDTIDRQSLLTAALARATIERAHATANQQRETEATEEGAAAVEDAAEAHDFLTHKQREGTSAQQEAFAAGGRHAEQLREQAAAAEEAAQRTDDLRARLFELANTAFDTESAQLALADAVDQIHESAETANKTMADSKATDREKAASLRDVREAQIGAAEQALATAQAYAAEQGAAEGSRKSAQLQINVLEMVKAQYPELAGLIDVYIGRLERIPPKKTTKTENDTGQANQDTDSYQSNLDSIPDSKTTTSHFDNSQSIAAAQAVINIINSIPRSVTTSHTLLNKTITLPEGNQGTASFGTSSSGPSDVVRNLRRESRDLAEQARNLDPYIKKLREEARAAEDAEKKEKLLDQAKKLAERQQNLMDRARAKATRANDLHADSIRRLAERHSEESGELRETADRLRDQADARRLNAEEVANALRERSSSFGEFVDRSLAVEEARERAAEARRAAERALRTEGVSAQQREDAVEEARDAALELARAEVERKREAAERAGKTFDQADEARALQAALRRQAQQGGQVGQAISQLIRLMNFPQQIRLAEQADKRERDADRRSDKEERAAEKQDRAADKQDKVADRLDKWADRVDNMKIRFDEEQIASILRNVFRQNSQRRNQNVRAGRK